MAEQDEKGPTRAELEDEEDLELGNAYLRALNEAHQEGIQLAPGVWYVEKREEHRGFWV